MKNQSAKYLFRLDIQLFADEPNPWNPQQNPGDPEPKPMTAKDYVEAIEKLKQTTVSKDEYEKKVAENKELLNAVLNGGGLKSGPTNVEEKPDIKQLREDLFGGKPLSNIEVAKKSLELRKALMDEGEIDPFVPVGKNITADENDFSKAQLVADVLQECIDMSEGDSGVFTNLLQLKMIDANPRVKMPDFLEQKK